MKPQSCNLVFNKVLFLPRQCKGVRLKTVSLETPAQVKVTQPTMSNGNGPSAAGSCTALVIPEQHPSLTDPIQLATTSAIYIGGVKRQPTKSNGKLHSKAAPGRNFSFAFPLTVSTSFGSKTITSFTQSHQKPLKILKNTAATCGTTNAHSFLQRSDASNISGFNRI